MFELSVRAEVSKPLYPSIPVKTTDTTTSHLTNPAKDAGQVIGYSHSTGETTDETTSHPTKQPEDGCQVVGYSQSTKPPKNGGQVAGYKPSKNDAQVAGYQGERLTMLMAGHP